MFLMAPDGRQVEVRISAKDFEREKSVYDSEITQEFFDVINYFIAEKCLAREFEISCKEVYEYFRARKLHKEYYSRRVNWELGVADSYYRKIGWGIIGDGGNADNLIVIFQQRSEEDFAKIIWKFYRAAVLR